jgi:hypothetical protein
MAYHFLTCDRERAFLLPLDVRDWLPADQPRPSAVSHREPLRLLPRPQHRRELPGGAVRLDRAAAARAGGVGRRRRSPGAPAWRRAWVPYGAWRAAGPSEVGRPWGGQL